MGSDAPIYSLFYASNIADIRSVKRFREKLIYLFHLLIPQTDAENEHNTIDQVKDPYQSSVVVEIFPVFGPAHHIIDSPRQNQR